MAAPVRFASALPRSACADRLREAVDSPFVLFGKKSVVGTVGDAKATLRKRIKGRNSFQSCLRVTLADVSTGTTLECRGGLHLAVIVFMIFWMGVVVLIGGSVFLAAIIALTTTADSEIPPAMGLVIPPSMLLFGVVLVLFGRRMARGEEAFLLDFVAQTTTARPVAAAQVRTGTVT